MGNLRYDLTASPEQVEITYKGDQHTYANFVPLALDSTWQELIDYMTLLRDHYQQTDSQLEEICQALIDRYDGAERTSDLKEEMRTAW